VLDLVEAFMRKQSTNPLIFDFIPILLQLAKGTGNKEQSLASKASGILNKRFDKMVDVPVVTDFEAAKETLQIIHSAAIIAPTKDFARVCSHCSIAVAKAVAQATSAATLTEDDPVLVTYRETLKTFMTKKSTKLPESFLTEFLQRQPEQAWSLREDLLRYAGQDSVNAYHQLSAFTLLTQMSKQMANLVKTHPVDDVATFVRQTATSLYDALALGVSDKGNWNANRIKEVIKSAIQIARYSHAVFTTPELLAQAWDAQRLRTLHTAIQETERFKNTPSVLTLIKQFAMAIDPEVKAAQQSKKQEKQAERKRKLEEKTQQKASDDVTVEKPAKKAKTSASKKPKKVSA
jgi:DNA polymerase phi